MHDRWLRRLFGVIALALFAAAAANAQSGGLVLQPEQASTIASKEDALFDALFGMTALISGGVCLVIVAFCFKYRRGHKANRRNPPTERLSLELTWTGIPIVLSLGAFVWGARLYYDLYKTPPDAMTVYVVGKQWMWKIQHPEGRREIDELHVPLGRPVELVLTSQDVIHDFYIPAFRTKQDAVPGRYSSEWFIPSKVGRYRFFCAQYCGTDHSLMGGWVYVMPPSDYQKWLASGSPGPSLVREGANLFTQYGCTGCHGPSSTVHGPSLVGIYDRPVPLQNGQFATADDKYLHDSILLPGAQVAAGYPNVMPSYQKQLTENQIFALVVYIRSMGSEPADSLRPPVSPATSNGHATAILPGSALSIRQAGAGRVPTAAGENAQTLRPDHPAELRDRRQQAKERGDNQ